MQCGRTSGRRWNLQESLGCVWIVSGGIYARKEKDLARSAASPPRPGPFIMTCALHISLAGSTPDPIDNE